MPNVNYKLAQGAKVDHLDAFERFLDDNHERLSSELHGELFDIYHEMNDAAGVAWESMEKQIEELQAEITDLEDRINELEEQLNDNE